MCTMRVWRCMNVHALKERILSAGACATHLRLRMHFCVSLALVRARELATARLARERLLAGVRASMCCQVIGT